MCALPVSSLPFRISAALRATWTSWRSAGPAASSPTTKAALDSVLPFPFFFQCLLALFFFPPTADTAPHSSLQRILCHHRRGPLVAAGGRDDHVPARTGHARRSDSWAAQPRRVGLLEDAACACGLWQPRQLGPCCEEAGHVDRFIRLLLAHWLGNFCCRSLKIVLVYMCNKGTRGRARLRGGGCGGVPFIFKGTGRRAAPRRSGTEPSRLTLRPSPCHCRRRLHLHGRRCWRGRCTTLSDGIACAARSRRRRTRSKSVCQGSCKRRA